MNTLIVYTQDCCGLVTHKDGPTLQPVFSALKWNRKVAKRQVDQRKAGGVWWKKQKQDDERVNQIQKLVLIWVQMKMFQVKLSLVSKTTQTYQVCYWEVQSFQYKVVCCHRGLGPRRSCHSAWAPGSRRGGRESSLAWSWPASQGHSPHLRVGWDITPAWSAHCRSGSIGQRPLRIPAERKFYNSK